MKATINISRFLVGVLFIFSGLVKANDPLGLSYKMQEFFELWNSDLANGSFFLKQTLINVFEFFHDHSLALSVVMIAFEIIAGAALLLGWRMKLFSWLLLLLIIFFTFLTGFAFLSGKFKNCGCFGDCLPITPQTSFLKDLLLLVLIGFLFIQRKKIKPIFSEKATWLSMLLITFFSFGIQWYTLNYLPFADCLPFKKGNNITEQMKLPEGARPDSFAIRFIYEKGGKQFEFSPTELPDDLGTYKFVSRADKLIRKGNAEPPIKGFILSGSTDEDSTQVVLSQPYAILLFCEDFSIPVSKWKDSFSRLYAKAKEKNIPVYIITTQLSEANKNFAGTELAGIPVFKCDYTAVRTAARTNPCLFLLKEGTILGKWSYHQTGSAIKKLQSLVVSQPSPEILKDSILVPIDTSKIK
ncbi:MAG: BT_3928 family protein [Bacteroidota bacterium]